MAWNLGSSQRRRRSSPFSSCVAAQNQAGFSSPSSSCFEDDEALLPVRLVVVGALERGPPVVHGVEEHVVEDDPAVLADDPAVVDDRGVLGPDALVADLGRGGRPARHATAGQEREDEPGIDEAGGEAHAGEPARRREHLSVRPVPPSTELEGPERPRREPQELRLAGRRVARRGEALERQRAGRDRHLARRAASVPRAGRRNSTYEFADIGKNISP